MLGMKAPPNLGALYDARFDAIFPELARKHRAVLVPFGSHPASITPISTRKSASCNWPV